MTKVILFASFLYIPWWDDELDNYEISIKFPLIYSQYFGASVLIAKHFQISAGTTVYFGNKFSGTLLFFLI